MIVRTLEDVLLTEREVETENWSSCRLLLKRDGMGFSLHDTTLKAGTTTCMKYTNHLEAVYCIEGTGKLRDLDNDQEYAIKPGTMYALSEHEQHELHAVTQLRMVCVFNPPVVGTETHDENGAYPLVE
ncbi:MAG: ectoine synthase [Planctomycetaceae bacterium]